MNDNLDFLDIITLLSFVISVENLEQNLTQNDKQQLQNDLSEKADIILSEIHTHLEKQDKLLTEIMDKINNITSDFEKK